MFQKKYFEMHHIYFEKHVLKGSFQNILCYEYFVLEILL